MLGYGSKPEYTLYSFSVLPALKSHSPLDLMNEISTRKSCEVRLTCFPESKLTIYTLCVPVESRFSFSQSVSFS